MDKSEIVSAIRSKTMTTKYKTWRIGITHDLFERKKYWGETEKQDVRRWTDWRADSLSDAQDIEAYFIELGMTGGVGGKMTPDKIAYIYIF
jgi:hypothetical protein